MMSTTSGVPVGDAISEYWKKRRQELTYFAFGYNHAMVRVLRVNNETPESNDPRFIDTLEFVRWAMKQDLWSSVQGLADKWFKEQA